MKKKLLAAAITTTLILSFTACKTSSPEESQVPYIEPVVPASEQVENTTSEILSSESLSSDIPASETAGSETEPVRADGERFETTIILEGMEETVQYEHVKNEKIGFEMDYDYESFTRVTTDAYERFISVYDDDSTPENYMQAEYVEDTPENVITAISNELSETYEVETEEFTLEKAGPCTRIPAEVIKGTNNMADRLQMIYVIPAGSGTLVVREHFVAEASEGFGRRFSYMLNTLKII